MKVSKSVLSAEQLPRFDRDLFGSKEDVDFYRELALSHGRKGWNLVLALDELLSSWLGRRCCLGR